ncbi:MAG: hypothetical protein IPG66_01620 [Hydrogenophilales bacterium]|nr:hypothetical protein [Hydrogenophilales bacterium]
MIDSAGVLVNAFAVIVSGVAGFLSGKEESRGYAIQRINLYGTDGMLGISIHDLPGSGYHKLYSWVLTILYGILLYYNSIDTFIFLMIMIAVYYGICRVNGAAAWKYFAYESTCALLRGYVIKLSVGNDEEREMLFYKLSAVFSLSQQIIIGLPLPKYTTDYEDMLNEFRRKFN